MTHQTVTLNDGSTVRADPEGINLVRAIEHNQEDEYARWIARLKAYGVKCAHPDDGWVSGRDTGDESIHLSYPRFNDGLEVGDLMALGWPYSHTRIVKVTRTEPYPNGKFTDHSQIWSYHFEEVEHELNVSREVEAARDDSEEEVKHTTPWYRRLFNR